MLRKNRKGKEMNIEFWKASGIRAVRTMAQTAVAVIGVSAKVMSDVNWPMVFSAALLAGILSMLTSIATGLPEVEYREHVYMSEEEPEDSWIEEEGEQDG